MEKTKKCIIIIVVSLFLTWILPVGYADFLTIIVGDEFADTEEVGLTGMHPWNDPPEFRVLYYSNNIAKVYYFSHAGGEKAIFKKTNGKWVYQRSTKAWSRIGGTADDYLIWPYFRNWVI